MQPSSVNMKLDILVIAIKVLLGEKPLVSKVVVEPLLLFRDLAFSCSDHNGVYGMNDGQIHMRKHR